MNFDFLDNPAFYILAVILLIAGYALSFFLNPRKQKKTVKTKLQNTDKLKENNALLKSELKRLDYLLGEYKTKIKTLKEGGAVEENTKALAQNKAPDAELNSVYQEKLKLEEEQKKFKRSNKKLWEQSIAIHKEKERIEKLRQEIEKQHQEVTNSIRYAQRIQTALMPAKELLKEYLPKHFVMWKPRDIVSGDFFWTKKIDNLIYIVAADCTGHGVPGALMSMLGMAFLNEIISDDKLPAGQVLDTLRVHIKKSLSQTGAYKEQKDGMDLALCVLNTETDKMQYAGANNHLYLIRHNELVRYKADSMPIGIYRREKPFTNNEIQLQKGDRFYIFSDGFQDQFGGKQEQKFKSKQFKELLLTIHAKPMAQQLELADKAFHDWKGKIDQIDDVLLIGVEI